MWNLILTWLCLVDEALQWSTNDVFSDWCDVLLCIISELWAFLILVGLKALLAGRIYEVGTG